MTQVASKPAPETALQNKIAAVQAQMEAKLEEVRATHEHAASKGSSVEAAMREFLTQYLPRKLAVGHGEVIDTQGGRSKQTDVVIASEDHPFTFTPDLPGLFFIEGVVGAGEIKSVLTTTELQNACANSAAFKKLQALPGKGSMIFTNPSDRERFYRSPPFFLFAFESQLTLGAVQDRVEAFVNENGLSSVSVLDAVFVLGRGWLINFGDGKGGFQFRSPDGEKLPGWISQGSDSPLFDLLTWLSVVMPRTVRFDPIMPNYMIQHS